MNNWYQRYIEKQTYVLENLPMDKILVFRDKLNAARLNGNLIMACGNGGSASNCSHFIQDLGKNASDAMEARDGKRFRVASLCDNTSFVTAISNDISYEDVFSKQLEAIGKPGDLLVGVSVSGTSKNVVKAFEKAKEMGIETVALVGT